MGRHARYDFNIAGGKLSDNVIKTVADTSLPLGLPPSGQVVSITNGNRATWKPNTSDTRAVHYAVFAFKRTDPAVQVAWPNPITSLPAGARLFIVKDLALNDHSDATRNLATQKTDYYVVPLFRDFSPSAPTSSNAFYLGFK